MIVRNWINYIYPGSRSNSTGSNSNSSHSLNRSNTSSNSSRNVSGHSSGTISLSSSHEINITSTTATAATTTSSAITNSGSNNNNMVIKQISTRENATMPSFYNYSPRSSDYASPRSSYSGSYHGNGDSSTPTRGSPSTVSRSRKESLSSEHDDLEDRYVTYHYKDRQYSEESIESPLKLSMLGMSGYPLNNIGNSSKKDYEMEQLRHLLNNHLEQRPYSGACLQYYTIPPNNDGSVHGSVHGNVHDNDNTKIVVSKQTSGYPGYGINNRNSGRKSYSVSIFKLPNHVIIEVFSYLSIQENAITCLTSKKINELLSCDFIWRKFYNQIFNTTLSPGVVSPIPTPSHNLKDAGRERFLYPLVGDRIQIFWTGQFILAQQGPYRGKAWWFADIIDRKVDSNNNTYHIRYEGWQNSWDEWVPRDRIRWFKGLDTPIPSIPIAVPPSRSVLSSTSPSTSVVVKTNTDLLVKPIVAQSLVELQIAGRLCTAWLECTVAEVIPATAESTTIYVIRDAIMGQDIRVGRERLRFIR